MMCRNCKYKNMCEDSRMKVCLLKDNEHLVKVGSYKTAERIRYRYKLITEWL